MAVSKIFVFYLFSSCLLDLIDLSGGPTCWHVLVWFSTFISADDDCTGYPPIVGFGDGRIQLHPIASSYIYIHSYM